MSHINPSEDKKPAAPDIYAPPLWLKIIGPVLGLGAAAATLVVRVGDAFYKKEKHRPGVRDLNNLRNTIVDQLTQVHNDHALVGVAPLVEVGAETISDKAVEYFKPVERVAYKIRFKPGTVFEAVVKDLRSAAEKSIEKLIQNPTDTKMFRTLERDIIRVYDKAKDRLIESKGIPTKGFKRVFEGTWKRWSYIGGDTRAGILVSAVISGGVAMASLFMLNLNSRLRNELRDIHGRVDEAAANAGVDFSEKMTIKDTAPALEISPSSKVDVQDAQHDRMAALPEKARA